MLYFLLGLLMGSFLVGLSFAVGHNVGKTGNVQFPGEKMMRSFTYRWGRDKQ